MVKKTEEGGYRPFYYSIAGQPDWIPGKIYKPHAFPFYAFLDVIDAKIAWYCVMNFEPWKDTSLVMVRTTVKPTVCGFANTFKKLDTFYSVGLKNMEIIKEIQVEQGFEPSDKDIFKIYGSILPANGWQF